ncbi:hypothetical protein B0H10DRAFT_2198263 [Mycena sp. CBHHK59/15]|nr:hypothetical protein B0H10DRAFT_2198263 [Mycena sp. CBHHK59/15]
MPTKRLKEHSESGRHLKARQNKDKSQKAARTRSQSSAHPKCHAAEAVSPGTESTGCPTNVPHSCDAHPALLPHVHSPIEDTTDLSADPFVQFAPDPTNDDELPLPDEFSRRGWKDSSGRRVFFSAGSEESDPLAESLARALSGAHNEGTIEQTIYTEETDRQDPLFCLDAPDSDIDDGITAEELNSRLFGPDANSEWFPYPDKAAFLTDVLFSSPRLRFSRAQQKAVLSWAKDLGANVPSYTSFRKTQDALLAEVDDPTKRQESGRGNVWYLNEISDSIKKDMSNPFTRADMVLYPEDAGNKLGEVWHGDKMLRDIPDHLLSPTIRHNGVIYYVNELVKCMEGRWFLPKRWLTRNSGKVMFASGHPVSDSVATQSDEFAQNMPHSLREKAGLRMVYSIPLAVFIDDVSGNKSKQWNKHFSCYMSNGALPRTKLENEFHVRFVTTSPFASPLEIMQGVRASIEETFAEPVVAWDCEAKEEVLLRSYGLLFAGDNPMQAELCSCAGLSSNFFCRTCKAGGTREWKQSNEGFAEVLKPGIVRASADTAEETFQQILTALEPNVATTLTEAVRASGVKDVLAQPIIDLLVKTGQDLRKANPDGTSHSPDEVQTILTEELKKHQQKGEGITNPLFDMDGVDMHKDTPTEILHTILLGVVKYYWGQTIWLLEKGQDFALFQTRLNSIVSDGLNVPKIQADYMCQYRGGLIGKHFKTLSQIMAFAVQGLVPPDVLEAWLILGRLTVLLWHTEIDDVGTYTAELEKCIDDFINITCKCSPSILISKPKFHFLLHLPFLFDVLDLPSYFRRNVGTLPGASPELTVSSTSSPGVGGVILQLGCGLAQNLEFYDTFWIIPRWRQWSGYLQRSCMSLKVGEETPERKVSWNETVAGLSKSIRFPNGAACFYKTMKALVSRTGDKTVVGQNVIFRHEGGRFSPLSFGTIREIISSADSESCTRQALVTVEQFEVEPTLHPVLFMPTVIRSKQLVVVLPEDIESAVNLQHDCHRGKCGPHASVSVLQEREATTITRARIKHTDNTRFIVNMASLHNYRQILAAIPAYLHPHSFTVPDQDALRVAAAVQIREKNCDEGANDLICPPTSDPVVPEHGNDTGQDADEIPDGEIESQPIFIAVEPTVLENPVFSRVGVPRARKPPPLKQAPTTLEACTNTVLKVLCKQAHEVQAGNKADLLKRLRNLTRNAISPAEIKIAFDTVQLEAAAQSGAKRKRNSATHELDGSQPVKRRRGAVDEPSRKANEELLRPLFFHRKSIKLSSSRNVA